LFLLNLCSEQTEGRRKTSPCCRGKNDAFPAAGGRDVPKGSSLLLLVIFSSAVVGAQVVKPSTQPAEPDFSNALTGSALSCTRQDTFVVPPQLVERARVKARLLVLLRQSLFDDANGIVNIARENEIKKLANKLKNEIGR
jgi:hypothetical protein